MLREEEEKDPAEVVSGLEEETKAEVVDVEDAALVEVKQSRPSGSP